MAEREFSTHKPTTDDHLLPAVPPEIDDDSNGIWPIFARLWNYRRFVGLACVAGVVVFVLWFALAYLRSPNQVTAQVGFRLLFDGADKGQYPNGSPFGPSDITSIPVLEEVYKANNLDPFGPFQNFKGALFVRQANRQLELLEEQFRARLADTKLTPLDRQRVERDFEAQRKGLSNADFELVFIRSERFRQMPTELAEKVLYDILSTYAIDADQKRGALKYRVMVPTRNILRKDLIDEEDYIVSLDIVRNTILKIQAAAAAIYAIPGAKVLRIGPKRLALTDIQSNLDDLVRFRVNPIIGLVRSSGVTKNAAVTIQYLRNQLFAVNLDREAARRKVEVYADSLRRYVSDRPGAYAEGTGTGSAGAGNIPALIPQLGDSFFDRLIQLGTKGDDTVFRQELINKATDVGIALTSLEKEAAYYQDLLQVLERPSASDQKQFLALFQTKYPRIFDELLEAIDNINLFYETLSQQNLNPTTLLVEITAPASVHSESGLDRSRVLVSAAVYFFFVGIGIIIGISLYARFRGTPATER
jgi:hypothetical protein